MLLAIIDQRNGFSGKLLSISKNLHGSCLRFRRGRERDVIDGFVITVMDFETRPSVRHAWFQAQFVAFSPEAEKRFGNETIHPSGGAGVPSPTTPAQTWLDRID